MEVNRIDDFTFEIISPQPTRRVFDLEAFRRKRADLRQLKEDLRTRIDKINADIAELDEVEQLVQSLNIRERRR